MIPDVDMLGSGVKHWVFRQFECTLIVTLQNYRLAQTGYFSDHPIPNLEYVTGVRSSVVRVSAPVSIRESHEDSRVPLEAQSVTRYLLQIAEDSFSCSPVLAPIAYREGDIWTGGYAEVHQRTDQAPVRHVLHFSFFRFCCWAHFGGQFIAGINWSFDWFGIHHSESFQDVHDVLLLGHFDVSVCTLLDLDAKAIVVVRSDNNVVNIDGSYCQFSSSSLKVNTWIAASCFQTILRQYADTKSNWCTIRPWLADIAKIVLMELSLATGAYVSWKSMLGLCRNPLATSLAFRCLIDPSALNLLHTRVSLLPTILLIHGKTVPLPHFSGRPFVLLKRHLHK
ncbi:hypothetical protein Tsp_12270 [Trichinella spiralis]|uniref:hypothetical protein n=1 Tax=Trichinella spiralis TaxID=6334 RepID=UPI0001EFD5F6|nr:hypothetical protein Tsp_12270 [Trichinella spiralis]